MSGPVSGALPFWLDNEKWIIKDGWLTNPGPMTLRIDKDTADAIVKDNMVAGAAINWLRYMGNFSLVDKNQFRLIWVN